MSKKEKEVIDIEAKDNTKEILDQIKQIRMLMFFDRLKGMNNEEKINYLHKIGLSKENIVELVVSLDNKSNLNLTEEMEKYKKFLILNKEGYSNKQIAELFNTTADKVRALINQYKK